MSEFSRVGAAVCTGFAGFARGAFRECGFGKTMEEG